MCTGIRSAKRKAGALFEDGRKRHGLLERHAASRKRQELPGQLPRPPAGALGLIERPRVSITSGGARPRDRDVAHHRHQDVVEVVRNAAGEQAERRDAVCVGAFFTHLQRLGDISKCHDHPNRAAVRVSQGRGDLFNGTFAQVTGDEDGASARWSTR